MDEKEREKVALFRFGLIAPILQGQVTNIREYLAEVADRVHQVPHYGLKEYAPKTIECWVRDHRREGFEGLKPKARSDRGQSRKISPELQERLLSLRKEQPGIPVSVFYDQLIAKGVILPCDFSYSSVYRFLKRQDLVRGEIRREPERKRFAYDTVNMLWQGDVSYGPYLKLNGRKVQAFLFAFIDDCSRLIPFARFCLSEKYDSLKIVFKEAILRRGIPRMVYVDNGKIYHSDQFHVVCASLGITLIHTRPYDAQAKGKIERFFLTVKQRFYPRLEPDNLSSLESLNRAFWEWLETDYHRSVHTALGMSPLDKFLSQASQVRMVEDPASLEQLFLQRERRTVKHDGTISLNKRLFEVPPQFIGQKIEVRFDPEDPGRVFVFADGVRVAEAKPVNLADNARVKRDRFLSFARMLDEEGKG